MAQKLAFTFHKAGSMAIHERLRWLSEASGLPYFSPNNEGPEDTIPNYGPDDKPTYWKENIKGKSGLIGPLRRPVDLPKKFGGRGVICVRDPRDALTSMFFSFVFSHGGIADEKRKEWEEGGIDQFVIQRSKDMKARFTAYRETLERFPDWPTLNYEEMVLDFPAWFSKFVAGLGVDVPPDAINAYAQAVADENKALLEARKAQEVVDQHKRRMAPGDHKEKLKPATIRRLNDLFAEDLEHFGYVAA